MLEAVGLSRIEEHTYDLLVTRGRMSLAAVIAESPDEAELLRPALDTLVEKGLVRRLAGPEQEFVVAPPEYAIEVLIGQQMSALQALRARSAELAARARRVTEDVDPSGLVEVVSGKGSARRLFLQVVASAREEIAVFDCPPYAVDPNETMGEQAVRLASGLRMRTVFDRSLLEDPVQVRRILRGAAAGEQARVARVPLKLAVIDREWAMLPLLHARGETPEAVVIVRRSVLMDSLLALFDSVWEHALEVKPQTGDELTSAGTPEGDLRQLARLLAAGMTEVAIANHLGVSQRTVRRRIKDLLDELRVDSRFAAGVRAVERGWL